MDNRNLKQSQLEAIVKKMIDAAIKPDTTQREVARMYGFTEATVSRHVRAFKDKGEYRSFKKRGRPPETIQKLTNKQQQEICKIIEKSTPDKEGLNCVLWTRRAVRDLITRIMDYQTTYE